MTAVDPSVTPATIATIDGPADAVGINDLADTCLSLHDRFDPSAGQTRWSLQPCTVVVADESPVIVAVGEPVVPVQASVLPATGATSSALVLAAAVVLVVGVVAVLGSRIRSRGPRLPRTRIEPSAHDVGDGDDFELSRVADIALRVMVWIAAPILGCVVVAYVFKRVAF